MSKAMGSLAAGVFGLGLLVATQAVGCSDSEGGTCGAVCDCVVEQAGSDARDYCQSICADLSSEDECTSTLAAFGISGCDSACSGFSSGGEGEAEAEAEAEAEGPCQALCDCYSFQFEDHDEADCLGQCEALVAKGADKGADEETCLAVNSKFGVVGCDGECSAF